MARTHIGIAILNFFFGQGDSFIPLYVTIIGAAVIGQARRCCEPIHRAGSTNHAGGVYCTIEIPRAEEACVRAQCAAAAEPSAALITLK